MTSANLIMLFAILAYLAVVVGIGAVLAKKKIIRRKIFILEGGSWGRLSPP